MNQTRVAVIGADLLGLRVAQKLDQAGYDVTVIADNPRLPGVYESTSVSGIFCDRFFHFADAGQDHSSAHALLADLGLEDQTFWNDADSQLFTGFQAYALNKVTDILFVIGVSSIEKLRFIVGCALVQLGCYLPNVSHEFMAKGLKHLFGKHLSQRILKPLSKARYGNAQFAPLEGAQLTFIQSLRWWRKKPAAATRMTFVRGGYRRVFERLRRDLAGRNVRPVTSVRVGTIQRYQNSLALVTVDGILPFDRVIITSVEPQLVEACVYLEEWEVQCLKSLRYQGCVSVVMTLKRSLGDVFMTYIDNDDIPFDNVLQVSRSMGIESPHLLYMSMHVSPDHKVFETDDVIVRSQFEAGLMILFSEFTRANVLDCKISRCPYYRVDVAPGQSRPTFDTSDADLFVVNGSQLRTSAANLNEVVSLADAGVAHFLNKQSGDKKSSCVVSLRPASQTSQAV